MVIVIEVRTAGKTVAFLSPNDGVKEAWLEQKLNGECTLSFSLPLTCPKWKDITSECKLIANGKEFVILRPDVIDFTRDTQGHLWGDVVAVESWYLLNKKYPTVSNHPDEEPQDLEVTILSGGAPTGGYYAGSAGSALTYLLDGSGWTLGVCDVSGVHDLETEKLSLLENIEQVQKIWGGILVWDTINKVVSLRSEENWQPYTGFQVRYKKNEKSITRTENNDIVTRLYLFGEDDLDIASVNYGRKYIDDFSYTSTVYEGKFIDQEIDNPWELLEKGRKELAKICRPRYTYHAEIVDLRTLPGYAHETFNIGDLVDIVDEDLGTDGKLRIVGYKYNVFQPWRCELEIGEPEERLESRLADAINYADFIGSSLKPNPTISNALKGYVNTLVTQIHSADGYTRLVGDGLRVYDNLNKLRVHIGNTASKQFGLVMANASGERVFESDTNGNLNYKGKITITSGAGIGNLSDAGELATKDAVDYDEITGEKPPTDADCTKTTIDGGLITTGTVHLLGGDSTIKAGMTAQGSLPTSVRFWAGDTYENRAWAPYRVYQNGEIRIGGSAAYPCVQIYSTGTFMAGMGSGPDCFFKVPWNADGVYNQFSPEETSYKAARWKRDDYNYIYQDPKTIFIKMEGITRLRLSEVDSPHLNLYLGKYTTRENKGCVLKALCGTTPTLQIRSADDSGYIPIAASEFTQSSSRAYKENITPAKSALGLVTGTPIYEFQYKGEEKRRIGTVAEEVPDVVRSGDGISLGDSVGLLWKAVQELNNKVEELL